MSTSIGIIGGSGFYALDPAADTSVTDIITPYQHEPVAVSEYAVAGHDVYFIPRHGSGHKVPPHRVNYRANIRALKECGAGAIFAINVVGGIAAHMAPGTLVIPDQIIDYTWGRQHTYFEELAGADNHVDFTQPYDAGLAGALARGAAQEKLPVITGAVYGCTQGPRLESAAEIQRMKRDGCDIVGMTAMPEAALARELGIPYASLALVVNWAAGVTTGNIDFAAMGSVLDSGIGQVRSIILGAIGSLP